jgi:DNA-directed RNA polymerase specialized sigma24 family protein
MSDWERSGLKLRRWLMNAFNFYLKEEIRRQKRGAAADTGPDEPTAAGDDPERPVIRAFVVSLVNHALREAERACTLEGLDEHWSIFFSHFGRDVPYAAIAQERGIEPARCVVMARTARGRFRDALREALAADGVRGEAEADSEIMSLLEELGA